MSHGLPNRTRAAEVAAGAIPFASMASEGILALSMPAQVAGGTVTWTGAPFQFRVEDVWVVLTVISPGIHTTTVRRQAGQNITNAMDTNQADEAIVRTAEINDGNHTIASGGQLQAITSAASEAMIIYVAYVRT